MIGWPLKSGSNRSKKGRTRGLEPPNGGITIRCLNHLATPARAQGSYQAVLRRLMATPAVQGRWRWCLGAVLLGGLLVVTNPGEREFEAFAGEYLVEMASEELCGSDGLPLMARLVVHNCPQQIGRAHV